MRGTMPVTPFRRANMDMGKLPALQFRKYSIDRDFLMFICPIYLARLIGSLHDQFPSMKKCICNFDFQSNKQSFLLEGNSFRLHSVLNWSCKNFVSNISLAMREIVEIQRNFLLGQEIGIFIGKGKSSESLKMQLWLHGK